MTTNQTWQPMGSEQRLLSDLARVRAQFQLEDFFIWLRVTQGEARYKIAKELGLTPSAVSRIYSKHESVKRQEKENEIYSRNVVNKIKGFESDIYNQWA